MDIILLHRIVQYQMYTFVTIINKKRKSELLARFRYHAPSEGIVECTGRLIANLAWLCY